MNAHESARSVANAIRDSDVKVIDRHVESMIEAKGELTVREFALLVFEVCRLLSGNDRELVGAMLTKKVERAEIADHAMPESEQDSEHEL